MGLKYLLLFSTGILIIVLITSIIISLIAKNYDFAINAALLLISLSWGFIAGYSMVSIFTTTKQQNYQQPLADNKDIEG